MKGIETDLGGFVSRAELFAKSFWDIKVRPLKEKLDSFKDYLKNGVKEGVLWGVSVLTMFSIVNYLGVWVGFRPLNPVDITFIAGGAAALGFVLGALNTSPKS